MPGQRLRETEQLTRENGAFRREIDCLQRRLAILEPLLPKIYFLGNMLRTVAGDAEEAKCESSNDPPKHSLASQSPLKQKFGWKDWSEYDLILPSGKHQPTCQAASNDPIGWGGGQKIFNGSGYKSLRLFDYLLALLRNSSV